MRQAVIFDADGMIVKSERFSNRLEREYGIKISTTTDFFRNEFQECLIGKSDLREALSKRIPEWGWKGDLDQLLSFWFDVRANLIDERFNAVIKDLRKNGIYCYLATNNEKYRTNNLIDERGIGTWFDAVFSSYELGCKKPEPKFFESILVKSKLPKDVFEFWDDDPENVEEATKFGLKSKIYKDFNSFIVEIR